MQLSTFIIINIMEELDIFAILTLAGLAFSHQPSAISHQPSAFSSQQSGARS
jgi:hypothetical protein